MDDWGNCDCDSYRCWRCGFVVRRFFCLHGKRRRTSPPVLRAMLEAGGNPNTRDEFGRPIILMNWYLGYYPNDQRARLDLLLDRGADINSAMPESESEFAGYTLLLYRTEEGRRYSSSSAYAD